MGYEVDPQPVYIWEPLANEFWVFDGVIKVEHNVSLKIEDDPDAIKRDKNATGYYNNARNEGNEISIEAIMSPVYTTQNALAGYDGGDRSTNAYTKMLNIKVNRTPVGVITTLKAYMNMLIKSIQVLQDDTNPYGMTVQIVFHEIIMQTGSASTNSTQASSVKDNGTSGGRTPSVWVSWVGSNAI